MPQLVLLSDDEGLQQLIRSVATNGGWSIVRAPRVTELLPHELDEADLVVLDVSAPTVIDDLATLRAELSDRRILAVADVDDPRASGIGVPVLGLPCTITDLADALHGALEPVLDLRDDANTLAR